MSTKAVAYVSDILLGNTGEVIDRAAQRKKIEGYAADNGIEIVAWFEDEQYEEDVTARPGVRAMFASAADAQVVLVERVWAFSRSWTKLEKVFGEMRRCGWSLDCATLMWDCASQKSRREFCPNRAMPAPTRRVVEVSTQPTKVARPAEVRFLPLLKPTSA